MPAGRPSEYDPAFCAKVVDLGRKGKSKVVMAAEIGVTRTTFDNWSKAHPEFLEAITYAMLLSQAWWENTGQDNLRADKFNASVWSRSMAARFPEDWRETSKHQHAGPNDGPIEYANLTEEQIDARLAALAAGSATAEPGGEA